MITLDFTGLHEPQCKGVEKPGTDGSDFEIWTPMMEDMEQKISASLVK